MDYLEEVLFGLYHRKVNWGSRLWEVWRCGQVVSLSSRTAK